MLAGGLVLGCSGSGKLPPTDPYTGLPGGGGGTPGAGDGGATTDAGLDAGTDAGTEACDGGCLQSGQTCDPLMPNGGCAPGLTCEIDLATGTTYTCQ